MKVAIFGVGLIGGSMAIDLKGRGFASEVLGVTRTERSAKKALELGLVDRIVTKDEAIAEADVIVLCVPVNILVEELKYVLDNVHHAVVTDMGSTKYNIVEAVRGHPKRSRFVAAHPMAGTENSGPEAAFSGLFDNKVCILCDANDADFDAVEKVEQLFHTLKMNIKYMDAKSHDIHAAYISHVSHISSFVLASTVLEKEKDEEAILEMAGGGFESTVRLAKSSPEMWSQIFEQNKENILEVMDTYIEKMYHFRNLVNKNKFTELAGFMSQANEIKKILK
ncbi:MAG: prephenate dehydrogenase [Chitinophagales bacterium]|nr:prephenate dehydrogenase [Chitinophagales bacterium]